MEFQDGSHSSHLVFQNDTTLLSFRKIGRGVSELASSNQNVDGHTDGRRAHQSNRWVCYKQPTQKLPGGTQTGRYNKMGNNYDIWEN